MEDGAFRRRVPSTRNGSSTSHLLPGTARWLARACLPARVPPHPPATPALRKAQRRSWVADVEGLERSAFAPPFPPPRSRGRGRWREIQLGQWSADPIGSSLDSAEVGFGCIGAWPR
jgi:hypothetical protein